MIWGDKIADALFYLMAALAIISLIPLPMTAGRKHWQLHLPWASLLIWLFYEIRIITALGSGVPIRIDLAVVMPIVTIPFLARFVRKMILRRREDDAKDAERLHRVVAQIREKTESPNKAAHCTRSPERLTEG